MSNYKIGDRVRVKSESDIQSYSTSGSDNIKINGLYFNPKMYEHCGGTFQIGRVLSTGRSAQYRLKLIDEVIQAFENARDLDEAEERIDWVFDLDMLERAPADTRLRDKLISTKFKEELL